MYIARVPNRNSPPAILLRESYREQGKVKKRTLANLSSWSPEMVEKFQALLKGEVVAKSQLEEAFEIVRSRPHGHVAAVLGTLRHLKLEQVVCSRRSHDRNLVMAMHLEDFQDQDWVELACRDYPGERLVACRNPHLAKQRVSKREELLKATEQELDKIVAATVRSSGQLQGEKNIGLRVGKVLHRFKMAKHFVLEITDESFNYHRNQQSITAESIIDGIYVIRTSVEETTLTAEATVLTYKSLSVVERAFRSFKLVDLQVRPIYHRLADRVRAHILLCMLAYYVQWHMRAALAPMLFDDDEQANATVARTSVVAPAQRSPKARHKAGSKLTSDGLPVHSFQSLLADLATVVKNTVQPKPLICASFDKITQLTPVQQQAFNLLGLQL